MLKTFSITDIGRKRKVNQDYIYTSEEPVGNLPNVFIVADGMGGHNAGDYASKVTVETMLAEMQSSFEKNPTLIFRRAIEEANEVIRRRADEDKKLEAIERLLKVANNEEVAKQYPNMWFINHTSGFKYTSTEFTKEPVSTSEGYRANAADTNKFLAERIKGHMTTGLVMMDFAGVDRSGNYDVMGKRLVQAVINSN